MLPTADFALLIADCADSSFDCSDARSVAMICLTSPATVFYRCSLAW